MNALALVDTLFERFQDVFSKPQFENFQAYIKGLYVLDKNRTVNRMSKENDFQKNQSTLNRFVTVSPWLANDLRKSIRKEMRLKLDSKQVAYEIIDDTVTEKTGKKMEDTSLFFSTQDKGLVLGHDLVTLFVKQGEFYSPSDLRLYVSKENALRDKKPFKTKLRLAQELLHSSPANCKRITLFDSWYSNEDLFKFCDESKRVFVGRLKSNRLLYVNEKQFSVEKLCKVVFRGKGVVRTLRKTECLVFPYADVVLEGGRKVRLGFAKRISDGAVLVVVSNDFHATSFELLVHYSVRFDTEVFYRDAKQNLGLGEYRYRKSHGVLIHGLLVVTAYLILTLVRTSSRLSAFLKSKVRTLGDMVLAIRTNVEQRLVQSVHDLTLQGIGLKEIYSRIGLKNAKH